jgi:hypothetical protein
LPGDPALIPPPAQLGNHLRRGAPSGALPCWAARSRLDWTIQSKRLAMEENHRLPAARTRDRPGPCTFQRGGWLQKQDRPPWRRQAKHASRSLKSQRPSVGPRLALAPAVPAFAVSCPSASPSRPYSDECRKRRSLPRRSSRQVLLEQIFDGNHHDRLTMRLGPTYAGYRRASNVEGSWGSWARVRMRP